MLPSVWLVGSHQVGKHHLAKSILPEVSSKTDDVYNWSIDTKYYTADVTVKSFQVDATVTADLGLPEALVLVFDASDESSFKKVQNWAKDHDTESVEIKLLVANKADLLYNKQSQDLDRPSWLDAAIEWSVGEFFEYIETSALLPEIDGKLCLDGEKAGTPRVISALQAHMWPGMKRKEDVRHVDTQEDTSTDVGVAASTAVKDQTSKGKSEDQPTAEKLLDGPDIDPEEEMERDMDRFDEIFSELQGARERFSGMPDDKRRAAAAELAMRLANLLDDDEDEEVH